MVDKQLNIMEQWKREYEKQMEIRERKGKIKLIKELKKRRFKEICNESNSGNYGGLDLYIQEIF
jgi:restriction endonuclease S subunit